MPKKPDRTTVSEIAPEVIALVQPNSADSGLKNTPNVPTVPKPIAQIMKAARTMT